MTDQSSAAIAQVGARISDNLDRVLGGLSASDVFSQPVEAGGSLVVTAAAIERAGGFGFGAGEGEEADGPGGGGGGGGGGGSATARPVAVIRIDPDRITVQPIFDATKLVIAGMGAFFGLWRGARRR